MDRLPDSSNELLIDGTIETLDKRLGSLDPHQIAAWRAMSPARHLELAFQVYQFALDTMHLTERQRHPGLPPVAHGGRANDVLQHLFPPVPRVRSALVPALLSYDSSR